MSSKSKEKNTKKKKEVLKLLSDEISILEKERDSLVLKRDEIPKIIKERLYFIGRKSDNYKRKKLYTRQEALNTYKSLISDIEQLGDIDILLEKYVLGIGDIIGIPDNRDEYDNIIITYKEKLAEMYYDIKRNINILENGLNGEKDTYNSLKILNDKVILLQNVLITVDDMSEEHDLVLIGENGITSIEIKYFSYPNVKISSQGLIYKIKGNEVELYNNKNIIEQSRRHYHSLRRLLKSTDFGNVPIYSLIVSTNDKCTIENENTIVPVCYRNTIEPVVFNENKSKVLDNDSVNRISDYIENNCVINYEREYPLNIDINDIIEYYNMLENVICAEIIKRGIDKKQKEIQEYDEKIKELKDKYSEIEHATSNAVFNGLITSVKFISTIGEIARALSE